jgi:uncharacterized cupin superfamily protein
MTTDQNGPAAPVFRDAESVRRGPLPAEISMAPVVSGAPFAREDVLLDEAGAFFAVWACDAGVYPRVKDKRGSFMYLLEGAGTIVDDDGTAHELTPDSVLILPFGWSGHWNITQTVRKVYVHTTPVPPFRPGIQPATFASAPALARGDQVIFDGPDGRAATATIAPGVHEPVNYSAARFSYVLAGEASVTDANGLALELTAGAAIGFPAGWSGNWQVRTPLRTFDVFSTPVLSGSDP